MHTDALSLHSDSICSDAVSPDELFGDGAFWDVAKVTQKGTLLKVYIHAIGETVMRLADESVLVHTEWEFWLSTT